MPASLDAWYSSRDFDSFAARKAEVSGKIQLDQLHRLSDYLTTNDGFVNARIRFEVRGGVWLALELEYTATLRVLCQRCLEPVDVQLQDRVEFGIVESAALEEYLPPGVEPLVLNEERLRPIDLIEDELIVSLPLAPKHADDGECRRFDTLPVRPSSDENGDERELLADTGADS